MALQKIMGFYNEKGNVSVSVRSEIKGKVAKKLEAILEKHFTQGVVVGTDGAFYMPLAETHKGETIYARLDLTVSIKDPSTPKPSKTKETVEID